MYCKACGTRLVRKKNTCIVQEEGGIQVHYSLTGIHVSGQLGTKIIKEVTFVYLCPQCGAETTYEEQCQIARIQRKLKRHILDESE